MGSVEPFGGGDGFAGIKIIPIFFPGCPKSAVEFFRDILGLKYPDICGEKTVKTSCKGGETMGGIGMKVGNHPQGMNTGIGAAGPMDDDFFATDYGQLFFNGSLDGYDAALPLPPLVVCAVKADEQADVSLHQGKKAGPVRPVFSGKPLIRFIFCTA